MLEWDERTTEGSVGTSSMGERNKAKSDQESWARKSAGQGSCWANTTVLKGTWSASLYVISFPISMMCICQLVSYQKSETVVLAIIAAMCLTQSQYSSSLCFYPFHSTFWILDLYKVLLEISLTRLFNGQSSVQTNKCAHNSQCSIR